MRNIYRSLLRSIFLFGIFTTLISDVGTQYIFRRTSGKPGGTNPPKDPIQVRCNFNLTDSQNVTDANMWHQTSSGIYKPVNLNDSRISITERKDWIINPSAGVRLANLGFSIDRRSINATDFGIYICNFTIYDKDSGKSSFVTQNTSIQSFGWIDAIYVNITRPDGTEVKDPNEDIGQSVREFSVEVVKGDTIAINCIAGGYPLPSYMQWYRGDNSSHSDLPLLSSTIDSPPGNLSVLFAGGANRGQIAIRPSNLPAYSFLPGSGNLTGGQLVMIDVEPADRDLYICALATKHGEDYYKIRIHVYDPLGWIKPLIVIVIEIVVLIVIIIACEYRRKLMARKKQVEEEGGSDSSTANPNASPNPAVSERGQDESARLRKP